MDEQKLIEMFADVKATRHDIRWLVKENKRINGSFITHLEESDKFRARVTRNTVWRITHHFLFGLVGTGIVAIVWYILK